MWRYSVGLLLSFAFIFGSEYRNYGSLFGLLVSLFLFVSNCYNSFNPQWSDYKLLGPTTDQFQLYTGYMSFSHKL